MHNVAGEVWRYLIESRNKTNQGCGPPYQALACQSCPFFFLPSLPETNATCFRLSYLEYGSILPSNHSCGLSNFTLKINHLKLNACIRDDNRSQSSFGMLWFFGVLVYWFRRVSIVMCPLDWWYFSRNLDGCAIRKKAWWNLPQRCIYWCRLTLGRERRLSTRFALKML